MLHGADFAALGAPHRRNTGVENVTTFGVAPPAVVDAAGARRITFKFGDADPMHENKQVFSCGSLAPKLKRKGGCMDCGFLRPHEPWEGTDGSVVWQAALPAPGRARLEARTPALAR